MPFWLRYGRSRCVWQHKGMAELSLRSEAKQPSMLLPLVLALLMFAGLGVWFARVYLHPSVTGTVDRVTLYPVHVEYKHDTGLAGSANQTEDELYVVTDITLHDQSEVPLFLSGFTGSFSMDDGTMMESSVISNSDLPRLMQMYPALKSTINATGATPLLTESTVAKGATAHGYIVLTYNVPQSVWDKRKSADVTVKFYHQDPLTMPLPN